VVAGSELVLTARPDRLLVYHGGLKRSELEVEAGTS
jgi:hypothetical protein